MKEQMKNGLFRIADDFDNNPLFQSVRQGMVMMIPLLVSSAVAFMLSSLPISGYQEFLNHLWNGQIAAFLGLIRSASEETLAIGLALTTCFSYAMQKNQSRGDAVTVMLTAAVSLIGFSGVPQGEISVEVLGSHNIFAALFIALGCSVLFFKIKETRFFRIRWRGVGADACYAEAVSGVIPALLVVAFFVILRQLFVAVLHVDSLQEILETAVRKLLDPAQNSLPAAIVTLLLVHGMWLVGIHGSYVLGSVIYENFGVIREDVVYNKTFQDVFVCMGGTGSVLCLVTAILLFSRKGNIKNIAKLSFPTVIFNISEIIAFGLPVILNPIFVIPYLLAPVVMCLISYAAVYIGIVPHVVSEVEWTTPVFLSGYLATGSVAGSILQAVCLAAGVLIYLPFLRLFEEQRERQMAKNVKELTEELQRQEEANAIMPLTQRKDVLGGTAKVLAEDLKDAIRDRKLFFLYQPQMDTQGKCIGAEALIRWRHPIAGPIYPPLVIQLAKEEKLLHDIETYMFDEIVEGLRSLENSTDRNIGKYDRTDYM